MHRSFFIKINFTKINYCNTETKQTLDFKTHWHTFISFTARKSLFYDGNKRS